MHGCAGSPSRGMSPPTRPALPTHLQSATCAALWTACRRTRMRRRRRTLKDMKNSLYHWREILHKEPAALAAAAGALLSAVAAFLPISGTQQVVVVSALFVVLGLFTRSQVSPVSSLPSSEVPDESVTEEEAV